jgi:hypothetical protein
MLFDDIPRPDMAPHNEHEALFCYLNRSGRPEAARVRQLAEKWLTRYSANHRGALISRLRSSIDDQHRSAFFELFVHELLLVRGHQILAIEPKLSHTDKSPDFLVKTKEGHRLYLECVLATGRSQSEVAAQKRLNQVRAAIDKVNSPRHFLELRVFGLPTEMIQINAMIKKLQAWIDALPNGDSTMNAPSFTHNEHGATFIIKAFPRQNPGRAIGVQSIPPRQVTVDDDLKSALKNKANRYGRLDHPYVVAVNALDRFARQDDAFDALFGSTCTVVEQTAGKETFRESRNPDGIWHGPGGARHQGLSAVLSTERIDPWDFARRRGRLIRNPWATAPIPFFDLGVDDIQPQQGRCHITAGQSMGEIFSLPDGWPEA